MAAPSMTVDDGFDPAKQYGGTIPNPPPPGFWGTALPSPEPQDFDLFFQPEIPDISLLTSAMVAACVTVKEAPSEWNTRTTTPFVHNLSNDLNSSAIAISNPSRDVNVNDAAFWCVHAIGAYEYTIGADGDGETSYTYGTATTDGSTIITIYNETIRDGAVYFSAINHNQAMMTKINVFHETLHRFGLDHPDGGVMATGNSNNLPNGNPEPHSSTTANTRSTYLLTEHIQKVQVRDYPR